MQEAYSRVIIDRKLREAGWDIENPAQVVFEDHGDAGRADYVLKDSTGNAIALIEAKRPDIDPYTAKKQAFDYAQVQYPKIRFIYLANDKLVYLWDLDGGGDAHVVPAFYSQADLERKQSVRGLNLAHKLSEEEVSEDYFNDVADGTKLRPYQIEAWDSIASGYDESKRAFLLEMATGTGKTVLASLIISRFLRTNNAQNILFVVDRKSLAIQTKNTFERLLRGVSSVGTYWGSNRKNLTGANVVVATIQSLMIHGKRDFSPGYFDLIIHDEAHRSIYSPEARAALDNFVGATKIGLTATPRDFLKNVDLEKLSEKDPRKLERRIQRDTYRYFGCEEGVATFRYTIQDGVGQAFLIPPKYHKMNTSITQAALSDVGITEISDVELEEGESIKIRDLEKKIHFPERNRRMMEEFLAHALKTPDGEIGKALIFAVSYPRGSGNWYKGAYTPLISKELFDQVQKRFLVYKNKRHSHIREFPFVRLVRCGLCGSGISACEKLKPLKNGEVAKYVYYGCTRSRDTYCKVQYIREEEVMMQLAEIIDRLDIDLIGMRERLEWEIERWYKVHGFLIGTPTPDRTRERQESDLRQYAKLMLVEGTVAERRELLRFLKSRLLLKDRRLSLDTDPGKDVKTHDEKGKPKKRTLTSSVLFPTGEMIFFLHHRDHTVEVANGQLVTTAAEQEGEVTRPERTTLHGNFTPVSDLLDLLQKPVEERIVTMVCSMEDGSKKAFRLKVLDYSSNGLEVSEID